MEMLTEGQKFYSVHMAKTTHTTSWVITVWIVFQQRWKNYLLPVGCFIVIGQHVGEWVVYWE
eukprot:2110219-Prorocentrum_lima.AAC.1